MGLIDIRDRGKAATAGRGSDLAPEPVADAAGGFASCCRVERMATPR
jgi:hypothetical protein